MIPKVGTGLQAECSARLNPARRRRMRCDRFLPHETCINLSVDFMQPLLSAIGPILVIMGIGLQFFYLLVGSLQLLRKGVGHFERLLAILLRGTGGFMQQAQNGPPCYVELVDIVAIGLVGR
jgi:hypothetical protein